MIAKQLHLAVLSAAIYAPITTAGPEPKICSGSDFSCGSLITTAVPILTTIGPFILTSDEFEGSSWNDSELPKEYVKGYRFYRNNFQQLKVDTARGDGPFLHSFCEIILPDINHWRDFKRSTKARFSYYYTSSEPDSLGFERLWQLRETLNGEKP